MSDLTPHLEFSECHRGRTPLGERGPTVGNSVTVGNSRARPIALLITSGIALITAIAVGTAITVFNFRDSALANSERELSNVALLVSKDADQKIEELELIQNAIIDQIRSYGLVSREDLEHKMSSEEMHLRSKDRINGFSHIEYIALINSAGMLVNDSRNWPNHRISFADTDYFKALKSDAQPTLYVSEPVLNRLTGYWTINFGRRFTASNGEFLGIVLGAINLAHFENYFKSIVLGERSLISLLRTDGMLLARYPHIETTIGQTFKGAIDALGAHEHGVARLSGKITGKDLLLVAHRLGSYPLIVAAGIDVAAVLANWQTQATALISLGCLAALLIAVMVFVITRQLLRGKKQFQQAIDAQKLQLNAAVGNMSQGLLMFDSRKRIVFCNRRYIEMYGLSPDVVKSGCTIRELIRHRKETGSFSGDVDQYCSALDTALAQGTTTSLVVETSHGRSIRIVNQPVVSGGWVATHEDVTEIVRAEKLNEQQKRQLDAALENMSQGLCMFDATQRLVVCNKRYAELYGLNDEQTKPGTTLRAILKHRIARGNAPDDHESYINDRINEVTANKPYQITNRLSDGRYVSVVHRPMADGGWVATHEDVTEAKRREESFRLLFEGSPVPMWVAERESLHFLAVNDAAIAHYGYSRERFLSMTVPELRPIEDRIRFAKFLRALSDDKLEEVVVQHTKADGAAIDVCVYSRALTYAGYNARLVAIHDITKAKRAEDELRRTKKFLDTVIEHVPLPIVVKDVTGSETDARGSRFTLFNRAYEELTGDSRVQLVGKTAHQMFPKERADLIVRSDNETLQSDHVFTTSEHSISTSHNGDRLVTAKKTVVKDENGKPQYLLTVIDDVTERRRAEQRISYLAQMDSLTDLPNRATFVEYLAAALENASKSGDHFAILCIDLDRFKEVNDIYGHLIGDGLLREAARRLHAAAAEVFLARVGGDEFTLVVKGGQQPATAKALGENLLAAFQDDFEVDGHRLQLGLSIGGAVYPADGADAKTLIANADAALYQAKAETCGSMRFFEAEMGKRLRERRDIEIDLKAGVTRGDFVLHYQPQQKIASNKTIGFEALVRWQCPKRGLVAPGNFIPIAEESSLIIPLGEWILREACREAASWTNPLTIAVNISPVQFHHGDLPTLVHSILLETGLAPARLELEITEGVLIDDFSRAVSILRKLKSLGVHIAMDDFGSGYSSLSYLHSFPFDKIKIDQSFIGDLEHNHHSMAIVRAIITLGHSLDVPILAEGVETEAQRLFLAQERCDEMQGYLMGRPLPIANYTKLVGRQGITQQNYAAAG